MSTGTGTGTNTGTDTSIGTSMTTSGTLPRLLSTEEVAALHNIKPHSLRQSWKRWAEKSGFPVPVLPGRWCPLALAEWRKKASAGRLDDPEDNPQPDIIARRLEQIR